MKPEAIPPELLNRLSARARDPLRRNDAAALGAGTVSMEALFRHLGAENPALTRIGALLGDLGGLMKTRLAAPALNEASQRPAETLRAAATPSDVEDLERLVGVPLPTGLRQLYCEIADGGFGPGSGLLPLKGIGREYAQLTSEPAGPQNQPWPSKLMPLIDGEPGYDCLDLETGEIVAWDPTEIESPSDAAWRRSFKSCAPSLEAWLLNWLERPPIGERLTTRGNAT